MKILLVEDDDVLIKVLTKTLKAHHYIIDAVKDGEMGWTYGSTFEYDLIVLDVVLPKLDGISLCKRFRAEGYVTPILLLTSQTANSAKVQGLDAGADDYVVKPFDQAELAARMRALLRRGSPNPFPLLTWGDLMLNPSTCEVSYRGQRLDLTTKEYELLELMLRDTQHVFSSDELLDHLWSSEKFPSEATVRSHIRRVRHKLAAIGAPQDFIATLHGRGYYLKALQTEVAMPTISPPPVRSPSLEVASEPKIDRSHDSTSSLPVDDRSTTAQQQYLAFLNETWTTTQPDSIDQVRVLLQAIGDLHADQLTPQHQTQAQHLAHKLAGTLGIFGLHKAVHLARQLEHWLGGQAPLPANQAPLMKGLVTALQQEIEATSQIQPSQIPSGQSPLLLLLSDNESLNHALQAIAASRGVQVELVSPLALDTTLSALDATIDEIGQAPDVILLHLSIDRAMYSHSGQAQPPSLLQICTQRYPALPIIVMGDRQEWRTRLEVARHGGKLFLDTSTSPEQVIATVVDLLTRSKLPTKVMVVDDDHHWLRTLPTLLKPWGFKVTTLADPQQFWTVLQAVTPDVVVLDVNLPEINGFELCQMLRSDPDWQRLPVLFLSALTDASSQQKAFTVGADDYLHKPLMGGELATRILNRLQRVQVYQS
ncbi:response regulator [Phormidium sp. FACHB-592]|uniref:Response regulator n=1 Tax=Stenomitos frigidus AS-A4 TaxID=2933935 RepID=A0ABV0KMD9_9CYAN|nr:response regulator [Phormidium sp. FACHB-592]MBD2072519.1 response regulator [Phormidium sp. FACHB-592]